MGENLILADQLKRGKDFCRVCNSSELFTGMSLGDLPIANELALDPNSVAELFELTMKICSCCGLGQVGEDILPKRLFSDYRYMSSISSIFVEHAKSFVMKILPTIEKNSGEWVLEIASNDGYLLHFLSDAGVNVLGVEPAVNIANYANERGIPTLNEFFSADLAQKILNERGFPRYIIANNVLAHVPDINDFVKGISILTGPKTQVSVENPSIINILDGGQFDTIYHEHFSYLSVSSMQTISKRNHLSLYDVEQIPIHGGSNRYWLSRNEHMEVQECVRELIEIEFGLGLFNEENWKAAQARMESLISAFEDLLLNIANTNGIACGYGAAAKSSTILNMTKVALGGMVSIADESTEKQGRYLPAMNIPIESPLEMFMRLPTDIVIFPWNIEKEIKSKVDSQSQTKVNVWKLVPTLTKIK